MKEEDSAQQLFLQANPFFPSKPMMMTQSLTEKSPASFGKESDFRSQRAFTPLGVVTTAPSEDDVGHTHKYS
jgi:hypothetical protein